MDKATQHANSQEKPLEKPEGKFAEVTRKGKEQRAKMPKQSRSEDVRQVAARVLGDPTRQ
jgi:hypothetical protein